VNNLKYRAAVSAFLIFLSFNAAFSQSGSDSSLLLSRGLLLFIFLLLFGLIILISEKMLQIQAVRSGIKDATRYSILPEFSSWFRKKPKAYVGEAPVTYLNKGFDLALTGQPKQDLVEARVNRYAVNATDFRGLPPIPKVVVTVGQEVAAGDPLFYDKNNTEVLYVAPVSGEIIEINRGEKRAITTVVILADKKNRYRSLPPFDLGSSSREQIVKYLCEGGVWPMIKERPFGTIASLDHAPDQIFISCFDSAPLAPDLDYVIRGKEGEFQKGLEVLSRLTSGQVHLGLRANTDEAPAMAFTQASGVEKHWFSGKHPAGNVGIQIHHTAPIRKGGRVWTLGVQEVVSIGALFLRQRHEADRVVALGGSAFTQTGYVQTYIGASLGDLTQGRLIENSRLISGDVYSGKQESAQGYLHYYDDQVSAIPEGNHETLFGWAIPRIMPSASGVFPNKLLGDISYDADTNTNGEPRAFVMTGQYEAVLPMDIYPQLLVKAIITKDIERMEGMGILELSEEDIALCEFACTSKQPLQAILREGLDLIQSES